MKQQDYHTSITASISAKDAFENICHVSEWWTNDFQGSAQNLNDAFRVRFGATFVHFKVIEMVPYQTIVWLVTDCNLHWLKDKKEWRDTQLRWEVFAENNSVRINFTHIGLIPEIECYESCEKGWNHYVTESLLKLITEHQGLPETKKVGV